jgi:hypothetical protein
MSTRKPSNLLESLALYVVEQEEAPTHVGVTAADEHSVYVAAVRGGEHTSWRLWRSEDGALQREEVLDNACPICLGIIGEGAGYTADDRSVGYYGGFSGCVACCDYAEARMERWEAA